MLLLLLLVAFVASTAAIYPYDHGAFNVSYGYPDQIVFPDQIPPANRLMKSLSLAQQMNSLQSEEDFLKLFNIRSTPQSTSGYIVAGRFGGEEERSSNIVKAKQAMCMPEQQVVPVAENPDPSDTHFPSCVRIKRCGGCCNHELLSCQPTHVDIRNYEIRVVKLGPDLHPISSEKKIVPLEEHTACKCACIKKEKDCTDKQYYLKEECRCNCKNYDEMYKCQQQNEKKYWDPNSCSCHCRKVEECSTNSYFDPNLCSCKSLYSDQWLSERRTGYNNFRQFGKPRDSQPVIVPLDANDPRRKHKEDPEYK